MDEEEVVVDDTSTEAPTDEEVVEEVVEEIDPLAEALQRAEAAEKEIYIVMLKSKRQKAIDVEKAIAIQHGGMGMARKMLTVLADIDRALAVNEDEGQP